MDGMEWTPDAKALVMVATLLELVKWHFLAPRDLGLAVFTVCKAYRTDSAMNLDAFDRETWVKGEVTRMVTLHWYDDEHWVTDGEQAVCGERYTSGMPTGDLDDHPEDGIIPCTDCWGRELQRRATTTTTVPVAQW